jgi:predicted ATP-grasp superfamily ATP-dependent carboligase
MQSSKPTHTQPPPVIVFHGNDNALSIVRSLGRRSIPVYVLNEAKSDVLRSRFARCIELPKADSFQKAATEYLLGPLSDHLRGAVLLAASDEALQVIAQHREAIEQKFRLDLSNRVAQEKMLDKLETYRIAQAANVPTPKFWQVGSHDDINRFQTEFVYPLIIKPVISHIFQRQFGSKFIVANNFQELLKAYQVASDAQIEVLLVEKIPGPDSMLCSYYTYLDEQGNALFDFTKRIIRRFPTNMGLATYHVTDHVPNVKEVALRLFRQAGLRGLANAEFKLDARDNTLKLIECNARFTAANGLIDRAGLDLASFVYNRIVGLPLPPTDKYRDGLTLWDPMRDYRAYRELAKLGQLNFFNWITGVMRMHVYPSFTWSDPMPAIVRFFRRLR